MRRNRARPDKLVLMKHDPIGRISVNQFGATWKSMYYTKKFDVS
jgi:hypothetical protein